ncbi:MAG: tetratricopeptide repeat protein [Desulfosudaceae bacterium]
MNNHWPAATRPACIYIPVIAIIIITGWLISANSLQAPFTFDDVPNIVENPFTRMTAFNAEQLHRGSQGPSAVRPVAYLSFAGNYFLGGYDTFGYHLINIIIHLINALLIFVITRYTLALSGPGNILIPLLAALLWLAHPVHTQSVTYIVQRINSLSSLFYLLSLALYIRGRMWQRFSTGYLQPTALFVLCLVSGVLALFTKQIAATLPLMIFAYEWYFLQKLDRTWLKKQLPWIGLVILSVLLITAIYLGTSPVDKLLSSYETQDFTPAQRLLTEPMVVVYYLSLLAWPHPGRLILDYDFPVATGLGTPPVSGLALLALAALVVLAIYAARRHRLLSFTVVWFLGTLVIESSVIGLALIFEHRTYLPSVFPAVAVAYLAGRAIKPRPLAMGLLIAAIALGGFWTRQRNQTWADQTLLWQDVVHKSPDKARPWLSCGKTLYESGQLEESLNYFKKAASLDPDYAEAYSNIGGVLLSLKQPREAVSHLERALAIDPDLSQALINLGIAYKKIGKPDQALQSFQKNINLSGVKNYLHLAFFHIGDIYMEQDNLEEAARYFKKAVRRLPSYQEARLNLGVVLQRQGQIDPALKHYHQVVGQEKSTVQTLNGRATPPDNKKITAQALNNLGNAYIQKGRTEQALASFRQALEIKPDYREARDNLAKVKAIEKEYGPVINQLKNEAARQPDNARILYRLGRAYQSLGMTWQARRQYEKALSIDPEMAPCLNDLAGLYLDFHQLDKATRAMKKLTRLRPDNPTVFYNLACLQARRNETDAAVTALKNAVDKGYHNWSHLQSDPDLKNIHSTDYYKELVRENEKSTTD